MKSVIAENRVLVSAVAVWFVGVMVVAMPFATTLISSAEHATVLPGNASASVGEQVECVKSGTTTTMCHFAATGQE